VTRVGAAFAFALVCACSDEAVPHVEVFPTTTVSELGACTVDRVPYDWHGAHRPLPIAGAHCVIQEVRLERFGIPREIGRDSLTVTFVVKRVAADGSRHGAFYADDADGRGRTFPFSVRGGVPFVAILGFDVFAVASATPP